MDYSYLLVEKESTDRGSYRVCGLRLGPNFGVWQAADYNCCLQLIAEKMRAFAVSSIPFLTKDRLLE